ncbi:MAG: DUF6569 family protein [Candidatus Competibacterales bacterium]|nr:DUF6569 family protein [Candidatus Competibacterales bacterium]
MSLLQSTLDALQASAGVRIANLEMIPIHGPDHAPVDYLTLDEALARETVTISEVSEGGSVPELHLDNAGPLAVLLVDGEELLGAKQNRIVNLTLLAPPGRGLKLPVSCVEQGRWAYDSPRFRAGRHTLHAGMRARKSRQVSAALRESGTRHADQGAIWDDIDELQSCLLAAPSATRAMADVYAGRGAELDDYLRRVRALPGQTGAAFAVNGQLRGLELFDTATTLERLLPKLIASYALDALREQEPVGTASGGMDLDTLLGRLRAARVEAYPALGEGRDLRLEGRDFGAGALQARERVVHLTAFPLPAESRSAGRGRTSGGMARASSRHRRRG